MQEFRIIDVSTGIISPVSPVLRALSPEVACREFFGYDVVSSGKTKDLVARVYWEAPNASMTMVRLYRRYVEDACSQGPGISFSR